MRIGLDECMKVITERIQNGGMCLLNKNQKCTGHPLSECLRCAEKILRGGKELNNVAFTH